MDSEVLAFDGARPDSISLADFQRGFRQLHALVSRRVLGCPDLVTSALTCLLSQGHLLIEGPPGLGKTLLAKTLADAIGGTQGRIQFTPDLLPSDIRGAQVWNPIDGTFRFEKGPVFNHVVLADEINRASPKTHSALLDVMEEGTVTVAGTRQDVPEPFFVIATQNPAEMHGTFQLPEAQLDRFALKVEVHHPKAAEELDAEHTMVVDDLRSVRHEPRAHEDRSRARTDPAARLGLVVCMIEFAATAIHIEESASRYCVALAAATRGWSGVEMGVSPRATMALAAAARVKAGADGRDHVTPTDLHGLAPAVFGHRLVLSRDVRRQRPAVDGLVGEIVRSVPLPDRRRWKPW